MSTLSSLKHLRSSLPLLVSIACQPHDGASLPVSAYEVESWLQTSRQIRFSFDANTEWQGWILHAPQPEAIAILLFDTNPSEEAWKHCVRKQAQTTQQKHIWLSGTSTTIMETQRYATRLKDLPIVQVEC